MKFINIIVSLSVILLSIFVQASPTITNVVPGKVYIPLGFDSNDSTEIVIEGACSNTCFRSALASHNIDEERKEVSIYNRTYVHTDSFF